MTTTTATTTGVRRRRPLLPLANLALAGAALTVSLVAITVDRGPASPNTVTAQVPTVAPAPPPAEPVAPANTAAGAGDCLARAIIVRC